MKNIVMSLCFLTNFIFAQDLVTDIDGNTYEYLTYGAQVWTVENAEMVTYRDGMPIPQFTDATEWSNLTTGAWAYYNNDPTKHRLYNWYAVMGIHDTEPNTPNKEFAPEGWHVPTDAEWTTLENHLIANDYNYDGTTTGNKIAKAMASTTGWNYSDEDGAPGNDQSLNNSSGFNAFPEGACYTETANYGNGSFDSLGRYAFFWSSTEDIPDYAWYRFLVNDLSGLGRDNNYSGDGKQFGFSVRFIKDTETASTEEFNTNDIILYPNPTTSKWTIESSRVINTLTLFNLLGQKVLEQTANNTKVSIDASNLKRGVYMLQINNTIIKRMIKR